MKKENHRKKYLASIISAIAAFFSGEIICSVFMPPRFSFSAERILGLFKNICHYISFPLIGFLCGTLVLALTLPKTNKYSRLIRVILFVLCGISICCFIYSFYRVNDYMNYCLMY